MDIRSDHDAAVEFKWEGTTIRLRFPFEDDHIAKMIRSAKTFYEVDMLRDVRSRLFFAGCAVDVGAHVGNHTVFFGKALGLRTIAFEPNPLTFSLLKANVSANGVAECDLHNVAAGHRAFRARMRTQGAQRNSAACGVELNPRGEVEVVTLDDILRDEPRIDVIKIDVESWEVRVIRGALDTIRRHRPLVYIEIVAEDDFHLIRGLMADAGYICWMRFNFTPTFLFLPKERLGDHPQ